MGEVKEDYQTLNLSDREDDGNIKQKTLFGGNNLLNIVHVEDAVTLMILSKHLKT